MPRQIRQKSESGHYHIIMRGTNRQNIFNDEADRIRFLDLIRKNKIKHELKVHAYCLMSNHIHMLVEDTTDSISESMKNIAMAYAMYFNKKYNRTGHLFQDRFKSEAINDDRYYFAVLKYIHFNPVKAGIGTLEEYKWSSYREYIKGAGITDCENALDLLGGKEGFVDFHNDADEAVLTPLCQSEMTKKEIVEKIKAVIANNNFVKLDTTTRKQLLSKLKSMGYRNNHISEATGVSESVLSRIV